jgi:hypothetical protein
MVCKEPCSGVGGGTGMADGMPGGGGGAGVAGGLGACRGIRCEYLLQPQ